MDFESTMDQLRLLATELPQCNMLPHGPRDPHTSVPGKKNNLTSFCRVCFATAHSRSPQTDLSRNLCYSFAATPPPPPNLRLPVCRRGIGPFQKDLRTLGYLLAAPFWDLCMGTSDYLMPRLSWTLQKSHFGAWEPQAPVCRGNLGPYENLI